MAVRSDEDFPEEETKETWRKELENNEAVKAYLAQFAGWSTKSFLKHYIDRKYMWFKYGDFHIEQSEKLRSKWLTSATEALALIMQKKVFDMQCLWRAGKLEIEGVDITFDFELWSNMILDFPYADIAEDDVEMMKEFLRSDNGEHEHIDENFYDWQNYDELIRGIEEYGLPDWYEFHNEREGSGQFAFLEDIRSEKEEFYRRIFFNQQEKERIEAGKPAHTFVHDDRPVMDYYELDVQREFVAKFEDRETRKYFEAYSENYGNSETDEGERAEDDFAFLMEWDEKIPVEAADDFRVALRRAVVRFKAEKTLEALPDAWSQYRFNRQMGLSSYSTEEAKHRQEDVRNSIANQILDGRVINGEPRDFNYLDYNDASKEDDDED